MMTTPNVSNQKKFTQQITRLGFLANISVGWKMGLMVFVLFVGILGVTLSAYYGLQSLRYQLSNIYDFMLIPIVAINHADAALADAQYDLTQSHNENLTAAELEQFLAHNESNTLTAQEIITRYDTEWVTTVSPEFTQSLREGGKLALQEQEIIALADYHTAFDAYLTSREKYLATAQTGNPDANLANETIGELQVARAHLQELIDINNQFADFSNSLAQEAYRQALLNGGIALVIAITIGLAMSYLIALSITNRLGDLTRSAASMQEGNLDQTVVVAGRDEVSLLGATFNKMATQLKELFSSLEQRVADRTKALSTSAEVSRRLSTATNPRQLAVEVVEQVQSAFHYYHAHIYFVDEETGDLIMAGGTGEAGAAMLARGHKIPKGRGLVGRAAETNAPVLVPDVTQAEGWLSNPLLPETKSEVAIPIVSGSTVLGVLDVQQNIVNGLNEEDVSLLQSLAGQIAISMQNARSLEQSKTQAEFESLVNTIGQKIQRAATMEETLQTAIREIGTALGASRVSASIGRSNGNNAESNN